jgi:hypothetical protein
VLWLVQVSLTVCGSRLDTFCINVILIFLGIMLLRSQGSVVCIATGYGLED